MGKLLCSLSFSFVLPASPALADQRRSIAPIGGDNYRPGSPRPFNPAAVNPPPLPPRIAPQPSPSVIPPEDFNGAGRPKVSPFDDE
jgi:hypothetical protein